MEQLSVNNNEHPTIFGNDHDQGWKKKKGYGPMVVVSLALLVGIFLYAGGNFGGTNRRRGDMRVKNLAVSASTPISLVDSGTAASLLSGSGCAKGGVEVYAEFAENVCCSKQTVPLRYPDQKKADCAYLGLLSKQPVGTDSVHVTGAVFTADLPTPSAYQNFLNPDEESEHSFIITGTDNDPHGKNLQIWTDTTYKQDYKDQGGEVYPIISLALPGNRPVRALTPLGGSGHPKPEAYGRNGGLLLGIVPVGDTEFVYNSKNNNIFLMNFCSKDQATSFGITNGFCKQLCEDAATCNYFIHNGPYAFGEYYRLPIDALRISQGNSDNKGPILIGTAPSWPTFLVESTPNGVSRTAPFTQYLDTLFGVAMLDDYILVTEAGHLSTDGQHIDQPGSVNIFTTLYKYERDNRYATHLFSAEIPPWSPVALASDLKRVVTGGIFCGEQQTGVVGGCDDGLMGVVDIWDLTGQRFGTQLQRNTTFTFDSWVTAVEFSPDGTNIIIGCQDGSISLLSRKNSYGWDCPWKVLKNITNAVPPTMAIPPYSIDPNTQGLPQVMQIDWSPDGNRFVVSSPTGNFFKIYST